MRERMDVLDTFSPSTVTGGTTCKEYPSSEAMRSKSWTSPLALKPKRKSGPTTTARAPSAPWRIRRTNSSGGSWAKLASKRTTTARPMPVPKISWSRARERGEEPRGARSGAVT